MIHAHRLAVVVALVVTLTIATAPIAFAQDASPSASPAPIASLAPITSPCPSPAAVESPAATASVAPEVSESPAAARGTSFVQAELSCPGDAGSTITVPPGASVEEILALGIGGIDLTVNSGGLQFVDVDARYYRPLTRALRRADKTVEDWTTHLGYDEAAGVLVTAFEIAGADASAFLDVAVEMMLAGLPSRRHERTTEEVAGKSVTAIRPARAQGRVFYFYPSDDVVWIVTAPDAYVTALLSALP